MIKRKGGKSSIFGKKMAVTKWQRKGKERVIEIEVAKSYPDMLAALGNQYKPVDLTEVTLICSVLEKVAASSIGPGCQKTLVSTVTGSVLITSDGIEVLAAMHFQHPLAAFVLTCLKKVCCYVGDGSKTFIVYISKILRQVTEALKLDHGYLGQPAMRELSTAIAKLKWKLQDDFIHFISPHCIIGTHTNGSETIYMDLKLVAETVLSSHFIPQLSNFFAGLFTEFLFKNSSDTGAIPCVINSLLENFEIFHVRVCGQPYLSSRFVPGIIIPTLFNVEYELKDGISVSFVILSSVIDFGKKDNVSNSTVFSISRHTDFINILSFKSRKCKDFIDSCVKHQINLIFCIDDIPEFFLSLCRQHRISAVSYMPEDTASYLVAVLRKRILDNVFDQLSEKTICKGTCCCGINIGGHRYVQLGFEDPKTKCAVSSLVLCASTSSLTHSLVRLVAKVLKSLKMCFEGSVLLSSVINREMPTETQFIDGSGQSFDDLFNPVVVTLPVGSFEFWLINWLNQRARSDPRLLTVCTLLKQALLDICQKLFCESLQFPDSRKLSEHLLRCLANDEKLDGDLFNLKAKCREPLLTKFLLIHSVLQGVEQILRLESVVSVKAAKCSTHASE